MVLQIFTTERLNHHKIGFRLGVTAENRNRFALPDVGLIP